ncbi:Lactosylceramide 4-alpha-galactosyltransferase [Armadillidium vulgare]|nr:Lactosylceramide 4-alpha-galactosyltransferase [Armadillidium vulgare]
MKIIKRKLSPAFNILDEELLSLPDEDFFDHDKSIFFIESFKKDYLPARTLCSIESAALFHRNTFIDVMMTSQTLRNSEGIKSLLKAYSNVRFFYLNATTLYMESALKEWFLEEKWKLTKYSNMNFGDALRFLLLYKYGGIYLDMDVFVLKNLKKEENFAGLESQEKVNSAIMGFRKGHPFLKDCITEITQPVDVNSWGIYGPILVTNIFKRRADINKFFEEHQELTDTLLNHPDILTLHLWNKHTKTNIISLEGQSILSVIARRSCPITAFVFDYKF